MTKFINKLKSILKDDPTNSREYNRYDASRSIADLLVDLNLAKDSEYGDPPVTDKIYNALNTITAPFNIRARLYSNIRPVGYGESPFKRVFNNIYGNEHESWDYPATPARDELWGRYLQIPDNAFTYGKGNHIVNSNYKPAISKSNSEYLALKNIPIEYKEQLINASTKLPYNTPTESTVLEDLALGTHSISKGRDEKGDYVSYYDKWDINPYKGKFASTNNKLLKNIGDLSFGIGKPLEIYDRIYLDDYYEIPDQYKGAYHLPAITVTAERPRLKRK